MKRRTPILWLLILLLIGGALYFSLRKTPQGGSFLGDLWTRITQEEGPLPTTPTEEDIPVDPVESEPLTPPPVNENLTYEERIEKGDGFFEKGFYSFARSEYEQAAKLQPSNTEPHLKLVDAAIKVMNYEQAMSNIQTLLQLDPTNPEIQFLEAVVQVKQSNFSEAKLLFEQINASAPLNAQVTYYRALLESLLGNHERAQDLIQQAEKESLAPELTQKIQSIDAAYAEFRLAELAEGVYLQQLLARAYNDAGEYQMTIYSMKELLKTRNELRDAWILYGFAYLNLGQYNSAKTAFEMAYQLDSTWTPTQFFLGITHQELGNPQEAIKFFNFALANQFQPEISAHQYLADLQFEQKNYQAAVTSYQRVIELNNSDLNAYIRPIWIYLDFLDKPQQALTLAEIAIGLFPNEAMAHNLLGWSQTGTGDYSQAGISFAQALKLDPNLPAGHYNLGKLYQAQRKYDQALSSYQKAYELDQNGSIGNLAAQDYNELLKIQAEEEG